MAELVIDKATVIIETRDAVVEMVRPPETAVSIEIVNDVVEVSLETREVVEIVAAGPQGPLGPEGPPGPPGPAAVVKYMGVWNAHTNTPQIVSGVGSEPGAFYKVVVGGSTEVDGQSNWQVGDEIRWNGETWDRVPGFAQDIDGGFF